MKEPFLKFLEEKLGKDFVLIACGLPAVGKTGVTGTIAKVKGYPLLRTDVIRLEVLKNEDIFDEKIASDINKRLSVYDEMFRRADTILNQNNGVILDGTFLTQSLRLRAAGLAAKYNLTFIIMEVKCPEDVAMRRILNRKKTESNSNALSEAAYIDNKNRFEKVDIDEIKQQYPNLKILYLEVDTTSNLIQDWFVKNIEERYS